MMRTKRQQNRSLLDSDEDESEDLMDPKKSKASDDNIHQGQQSSIPGINPAFQKALAEAGLILDPTNDLEQPHALNCEQGVFKDNFEKNLKSSSQLRLFEEELVKYLDDDLMVLKALLPVQGAPDLRQDPDSLIRIFLNIEPLQENLAKVLLEKFAILSHEDFSKDDPKAGLHRKILNSLRWLNFVVNGTELTEKLMEIIDAASDDVLIEVIVSCPEIIPDEFHEKVATALKEKYDNPRLTAAVLDTFGTLTLKPEVIMNLRHAVIKSLDSAPKEDLPVMVKFVSTSITPKEALGEIENLRSNLNLDRSKNVLSQMSSQRLARRPTTKVQDGDDFDVMVMDIIRVSIYEIKIADAWFQAIVHADALKTLDVLVLLLLRDLPNKQKNIDALVRNKIRSGELTEELLKHCFKNHSKFIVTIFSSVQAIAESLMCSHEKVLQGWSTSIYLHSFSHLNQYCKQEIVVDLMTQIGTNVQTRNNAIATVYILAKDQTNVLTQFAVFISSMLDHVTTLTLPQVRKIMDILSILAYHSPKTLHSIRNDLHMAIRKQITASGKQRNLKQIGILSAVAVAKSMTRRAAVKIFTDFDQEQPNSNMSSSSSGRQRKSLTDQAIDMLDMVKASTRNVPSVAGLFMDELSSIFESDDLDPQIKKWICDNITDSFQEDFVSDVTNDNGKIQEDFLLPLKLAYELNTSGSNIAVDMGQMVCKASIKIIRFIPQFRLMFKSMQSTNELADLDALLLSPIWMPIPDLYLKLESYSKEELNAICDCLFYAINLFREFINSFASSNEQEFQTAVLNRLKHILEMQDLLRKVLAQNVSYHPPAMLHLEDNSTWHVPESKHKMAGGLGGKAKKNGKVGKKKGTKRKAGQDITNLDSQPQSLSKTLDQTSAVDDPICPDNNKVDLDHYKPFFREWDMCVFNVLTYKLLVITPDKADDEELADPQLRPKEFLMLLRDLNSKLSHILVASKNKKNTFLGSKSKPSVGFSNLDHLGPLKVMENVVPVMDNILAGMEVILEYFKNLIEMNDGIRDAACLFNPETFPVFVDCLENAFETLRSILSWNGLYDQVPLMKKALGAIANRLNTNNKDNIKDLTDHALNYLSKFTDIMLNMGCANAHIKLIEVIDQLGDAGGQVLHDTSLEYLSRNWIGMDGKLPEKGAKFNANIEVLLVIYLNTSHDKVFDIIDDYAVNGLTKLAEDADEFNGGGDDEDDKFNTVNKHTFGVYYKVLLNFLVTSIKKKVTYGPTKNHKKQLKLWSQSAKSLNVLTELIKNWSSPRTILGPLMKGYRAFLEHFLKHCMPLMDKLFSERHEDCVALLKCMQISSRQMQYVCSHSKIKKDVALSNNVPMLKKALESFVFRVKQMLALNNAVNAFWLGNLKQRDIQGKELSSQIMIEEEDVTEATDQEEEESDVDDLAEAEEDGNNDANDDNAEEEESLEY